MNANGCSTRRHFLGSGVLGALALAGCSRSAWVNSAPSATASAGSRVDTPRSVSGPDMALSLASLQSQHRRPGSVVSSKAGHAVLPCMNRITGFLIEPADVILLGDMDPARPDLELDSLVAMLRNAFRTGAAYGGVPGCTIDPIPGADPFRIQSVLVFGMEHTCLTANRFVSLDYELKRAASGIRNVGESKILPSSMEVSDDVGACGDGKESHISMTHRYWFYPKTPARPRFERDEQTVLILQPIGVQLLTEQEYLNRRGERVGSGEASAAAKQFATAVDALLAAENVERYTRMVNDFRLSEVAKLLRHAGVSQESLAYFLWDYPLTRFEVPRFVGGVYRREEGTITCNASVVATGNQLTYNAVDRHYSKEYRGGVEVRLEIAPSDFDSPAGGGLANLRTRVLSSRPTSKECCWRIL